MITLTQYAGPHRESEDWTPAREQNAIELLTRCEALEEEMVADGVEFPDNPVTKNGISGKTFGGFRPQSCTQGAPNSAHKEGQAVDRYDPKGEIDKWLMEHQSRLAHHDLYIEHPSATSGWSHWGTRAPKSGNRVFYP